MRLIDADAEIAKIEQEIQRINEKIKRLENRMLEEPNNSIHVFSEQIKQCHRNIASCKKEIRVLQQYKTAYDVDKVVEQLESINTDNSCGDCKYRNKCDDLQEIYNPADRVDLCGLTMKYLAIEIVKAGGVNE